MRISYETIILPPFKDSVCILRCCVYMNNSNRESSHDSRRTQGRPFCSVDFLHTVCSFFSQQGSVLFRIVITEAMFVSSSVSLACQYASLVLVVQLPGMILTNIRFFTKCHHSAACSFSRLFVEIYYISCVSKSNFQLLFVSKPGNRKVLNKSCVLDRTFNCTFPNPKTH